MEGRMSKLVRVLLLVSAVSFLIPILAAAPRKTHIVVLGAAKKVSYSRAGDPAGAQAGEDSPASLAVICREAPPAVGTR